MTHRELKLELALRAAMKYLDTYGNHPIMESQAYNALNYKDEDDEDFIPESHVH